jgi:hypothetical protein
MSCIAPFFFEQPTVTPGVSVATGQNAYAIQTVGDKNCCQWGSLTNSATNLATMVITAICIPATPI